MYTYKNVQEACVQEYGSNKSLYLEIAIYLFGVFRAKLIQHVYIGTQKLAAIQAIPSGTDYYSNQVDQDFDHCDEKDKGINCESGAKSELQHVKEGLAAGVHELLIAP
jgi:hypothetical protein